MEINFSLSIITVLGTLAGIAGYFLMRQKFYRELAKGREREEELERRVYEVAVLKEVGDRVGYSLDAVKIVEIISGSIGQLLAYSCVSFMIVDEPNNKIRFNCNVAEPVSPTFVKDVRARMVAALAEMMQQPPTDFEVDERIEGSVLDEADSHAVASFFNLPIFISGKVVGIVNVSSKNQGVYNEGNTEVLYRIANKASEAVSRLSELLENEKSRLSQAVESLSDGLLMVDLQYQVIIANKRLRELLGLVDNPKIFDVVNALSGNFDIRTKMEEAIARDLGLEPLEISLKNKVLKVYVSKVENKQSFSSNKHSSKPMGVVVLFQDITDAKQLERLKQDFTAMMVHELRSPLTSIKSTVEMIKSQDLIKINKDELGRELAVIDTTSQSMLELVNDLLDVAKMEAGRFDVICEEGDLSGSILERMESFKPVAEAKHLKFNLEILPNLPKALFDKVRIKQVLNNLFSNAIKFTDSGEVVVKVDLEKINGVPIDILVSVKDTGIGIEREEAIRLFSKFGQLAAGRRKAGLKSSGLGLYITKGIVEASGGKIWVESAGAGFGSTLHFTVQIAKEGEVSPTIGKPIEGPLKTVNMSAFAANKVGQA